MQDEKRNKKILKEIVMKINGISERELEEGYKKENINANDIYRAIQLINDVITHNGKILIINDYDADGICSGYILYNYLKNIISNPKVRNNIHIFTLSPSANRDINFSENKNFLKQYNLIIFTDIGVNMKDFINEALNNNIYVIVIDHHIIETPHRDCIIIHPQFLSGDNYTLSGSGLTAKFVEYYDRICFNYKNAHFIESEIYMFAGMGTFADMVGYTKENRFYILKGYRTFSKNWDYGTIRSLEFFKSLSNFRSKYSYMIILPSYFNSIFRVNLSDNIYFNYDDITENKKELFIESRKVKNKMVENILKNSKIQKDNSFIFVYNDNETLYTVFGSALNKILYNEDNENVLFIAGITKLPNENEYKFTIRGRVKIFFIANLKEYFYKYGGHEYVYSGIIKTDNIEQVIEKIKEEIRNSAKLIYAKDNDYYIYYSTKEQIYNIKEIYYEDIIRDYNEIYPLGLDLKEPLIRISKNDFDFLDNNNIFYDKNIKNLDKKEFIMRIDSFYALVKKQLYLRRVV